MNKTTRTAAMGAATALALAAAPPAASADGYQFIISGNPVAAATAGVASGESAAKPLEVLQHAAAGSLTQALEVRQHSIAESGTTALNSQKPLAFKMIVR